MAYDSPAHSQAGKVSNPRLASLSRTNHLGSPGPASSASSSSRSHQLGTIGGRTGPGYSPYARRVAARQAAHLPPDAHSSTSKHVGAPDQDANEDQGSDAGSPTQPKQSQGLFGKVRSLPGRMLGLLSRSSSSRQLSASASLADVRAELDQVRDKDHRSTNPQGGIARSKTSHNLARLEPGPLPASSSLSALSSLAHPPRQPLQGPGRSAHSTLTLPPNTASTNGSGTGPSFLTAANLGRHSTRAGSPALSSTSRQRSNRSPSPLRNGLAGSMSTFQLAQQPPSPTSASSIFPHHSTLGNGAVSNPFGLTSRSPFTSRIRHSPSLGGAGGAGSVAGHSAASGGTGSGHPLFPYASTLPRGTPSSVGVLPSSLSLREGLSSAASGSANGSQYAPSSAAAQTGTLKRPYARALGTGAGSPLNPQFPSSASAADVEMLGADAGGAERARKKQLVWDPVRGLVSRERLEKEKAACVFLSLSLSLCARGGAVRPARELTV